MKKYIFTEEEVRQIEKSFYEDKISCNEIAKQLGLGRKVIARYIKEHNMTREPIAPKRPENYKQAAPQHGITAKKDEIGNRYGRLLVIKELDERNSDNRRLYLCKCDCGNYIKTTGKRLRSGITKSCGCLKKEKALEILKTKTSLGSTIGVDLTNKRFGKLTVIKEVEPIIRKSGKPVRQWLCQCDCGNQVIVQHTYLTTGDTQSCGCINSQGAMQIEYILQQNNIFYQKEYSFKQLKGKLPYRFDFAILNNNGEPLYLIEYDGTQHYDRNNGHFLLERIKIDCEKNKFCLYNNIPLIRIPYNYKDNLKLDYLLLNKTKEEFIVKEINHYKIKEMEDYGKE